MKLKVEFTACNIVQDSTVLKTTLKCCQHSSSRPKMFCKKGALRNFAKFTENTCAKSLIFHKVAGLSPAILLK